MKTAYLALGSNLGDREAELNRALEQLEDAGIRVRRRSGVIETAPQYVLDQPMFLNMAVEVDTELDPYEMLAAIHRIEASMGRTRATPKGPRTIDIDIVFYGSEVINTPSLTIPHPGMAERRFVLEPLAEIAPGLRHPITGATVEHMLASLSKRDYS